MRGQACWLVLFYILNSCSATKHIWQRRQSVNAAQCQKVGALAPKAPGGNIAVSEMKSLWSRFKLEEWMIAEDFQAMGDETPEDDDWLREFFTGHYGLNIPTYVDCKTTRGIPCHAIPPAMPISEWCMETFKAYLVWEALANMQTSYFQQKQAQVQAWAYFDRGVPLLAHLWADPDRYAVPKGLRYPTLKDEAGKQLATTLFVNGLMGVGLLPGLQTLGFAALLAYGVIEGVTTFLEQIDPPDAIPSLRVPAIPKAGLTSAVLTDTLRKIENHWNSQYDLAYEKLIKTPGLVFQTLTDTNWLNPAEAFSTRQSNFNSQFDLAMDRQLFMYLLGTQRVYLVKTTRPAFANGRCSLATLKSEGFNDHWFCSKDKKSAFYFRSPLKDYTKGLVPWFNDQDPSYFPEKEVAERLQTTLADIAAESEKCWSTQDHRGFTNLYPSNFLKASDDAVEETPWLEKYIPPTKYQPNCKYNVPICSTLDKDLTARCQWLANTKLVGPFLMTHTCIQRQTQWSMATPATWSDYHTQQTGVLDSDAQLIISGKSPVRWDLRAYRFEVLSDNDLPSWANHDEPYCDVNAWALAWYCDNQVTGWEVDQMNSGNTRFPRDEPRWPS